MHLEVHTHQSSFNTHYGLEQSSQKLHPLSNQLGIILLKNMEINVVLPELQSKQNMSCYV